MPVESAGRGPEERPELRQGSLCSLRALSELFEPPFLLPCKGAYKLLLCLSRGVLVN